MSVPELDNWWWPQPAVVAHGQTFPRPLSLLVGLEFDPMLSEDWARLSMVQNQYGWKINFKQDASLESQSYQLSIDQQGATLIGCDKTALFYGQLTLLQYLSLHAGESVWPSLRISDKPAYARRGALIDLGRTVSTLPMLKLLVRVLARLRYNEMHLRLYDDELCNFTFEGLPFGAENPFAMPVGALKELADYANEHHVRLVPELESWGHVGSLVYHRPDLNGGIGMYGGHSFRTGDQSVQLIGKLSKQVLEALDDHAVLHLGFDEANWYPDPQMGAAYSPEDLLLALHHMRCNFEDRLGKAIELRIWADHAGRQIPAAMRDRVILEPWQYWHKNEDQIHHTIKTYSQSNASWMMCLGQSQSQVRGAYRATRDFTTRATHVQNLQGVTIALWGWNHWSRHLYTLFNGAYYAWNPCARSLFCHEQDEELFDLHVMPKMLWWQSLSDDTSNKVLDAVGGPLVWNGRYVGGKQHGQPVASTVAHANTFPAWQYASQSTAHEVHDLVSQQSLMTAPIQTSETTSSGEQ